jgi:AraC-like DNA-binding protein
MTSTPEWVRVYRLAGRYDAEIVHAHYVRHRFSRHAHEHLVIGLVEQGVQQYTYGGTKHTTPPGHIFFVNSGEPHTGEPASTHGYVYRTLCLDPRAFRRLAADITDKDEQPWLDGAIVADRRLFTKLQRLHRAVADHAPTLHCESLLLSAVRHLLATHVDTRREPPNTGNDNDVATQVRQFLEAHYAEDASLAQLATLTSRSPFHVARTFAKNMGLPPHAFLESLRIARARELLRSGTSVADTALSVGYSDQSHFTHRFHRHTGFTPGQYRTATRGHLVATP